MRKWWSRLVRCQAVVGGVVLTGALSIAACGSESEAEEPVEIGNGDPNCTGPQPPVVGVVATDVATSRVSFDVSYRRCLTDPASSPGEPECQGLDTVPGIAEEAATGELDSVRDTCLVSDENGLRLSLPSFAGQVVQIDVVIPEGGNRSLVGCYDIGPNGPASLQLRFPAHEQQDLRTERGATTLTDVASAQCSLKITRDDRVERGESFVLTGEFACLDLGGVEDSDAIAPEGYHFRYDIDDGSFSADCFYE